MPDGFIPDEGLSVPLARILNPVGADHLAWRLVFWVNDFTPDNTVVLANLVQASWGGYSFATLDPTQWSTPVVSPKCAVSTYGTVALSWNVTGGPVQTNFGYALIDPSAGVIRFIQRFDPADIQPVPVGGQVTLLPQYTLTSAACSSMLTLGLRRRARGE